MENQSVQNNPTQEKKKFPFRVKGNRYLFIIAAFTLVGVAGGFAYYYFVGCKTGGCAITSSPYLSMVWGGLMGYLVPDFFVKKEAEKE
jgi:hypothetical protein